MKRVFIETTIPSYLAALPSKNLQHAARQQSTRDWWLHHRGDFILCTSRFVVGESALGDPEPAHRRLAYLEGVELVEINEKVEAIARAILDSHALPTQAVTDALHIATAAVHQADILLTWNCRHIANPAIITSLARTVEAFGVNLPMLCTPQVLMELEP